MPRPSSFWYDTDFQKKEKSKFEKKGWARPCTLILLLVWQWLRPSGTILLDAAHLSCFHNNCEMEKMMFQVLITIIMITQDFSLIIFIIFLMNNIFISDVLNNHSGIDCVPKETLKMLLKGIYSCAMRWVDLCINFKQYSYYCFDLIIQ